MQTLYLSTRKMIAQPTSPKSGKFSQESYTTSPVKILNFNLVTKITTFTTHFMMIHSMLVGQTYS
jgi:hypothetical protein